LSVVGGKSEEDTIERVLAATLGNGVAMQFNWNGLKGKKEFKNMEIMTAIFGTV
jgi:hypothetical protein